MLVLSDIKREAQPSVLCLIKHDNECFEQLKIRLQKNTNQDEPLHNHTNQDEQLYNATCIIRYKVTPRDILQLT